MKHPMCLLTPCQPKLTTVFATLHLLKDNKAYSYIFRYNLDYLYLIINDICHSSSQHTYPNKSLIHMTPYQTAITPKVPNYSPKHSGTLKCPMQPPCPLNHSNNLWSLPQCTNTQATKWPIHGQPTETWGIYTMLPINSHFPFEPTPTTSCWHIPPLHVYHLTIDNVNITRHNKAAWQIHKLPHQDVRHPSNEC